VGQGPNPVALMRTSWTDPDAIYLGFKAGSASVNHGHMDIGSFIMESDGVRWAMDFGSQNYESLESKGIQLFGRNQDAQRWTVFRLNNFVHNTLTIDGAHQRVKGYAKIDRFGDSDSFPFAISNITEPYEGQAKSIVRGVGIVDGHYVLVRDEIKAKSSPSTIRWNMLTPAEVTLEDDRAVLTRDGKKLYLMAQGGKGVKWKTWSTEPATDYDEPNPGTIMVGFEYEASGDEDFVLQVALVPEKALEKALFHAAQLNDFSVSLPACSAVSAAVGAAAARAALAALAWSGCGTASDHHYIFPRDAGNLFAVEIEAARDIGLRFHPCRGAMDLGESDGGLPPDHIVEDRDAILSAVTNRTA
jgi:hypothetical protein